jgi:DNA invertase Pin-like site-specific DNA recombinase
VAYYRVSTDKQGESGLGLEAQRASVSRYLAHVKGTLIGEYTEIESGKRHTNRPELAAALGHSKRTGACLVIAKLDRLARNVHFISGLMESAADFVACDMPQANKLTIHIMAAMAEHEREMISARTKAALEAAKERGVQLGNPNWQGALEKAWRNRHPAKAQAEVVSILAAHKAQGKSLREIAGIMNGLGIRTASGAQWHASSVRAALLAA